MARKKFAVAAWFFAGCAAFVAPASADPSLSRDELDFIGAVAPQGYSGDVYQTVRVGYKVCSLLDQGLSHEAIERFVADSFGDRRDSATYYALLFSQYATYHLCPRHIGEYGNI
jgi:hypothetical protein